MSTGSRATKRPVWIRLSVAIVLAIVALAAVVLLARWLRDTDAVGGFIETYPGETHLPEGAPVGFPAWLAWQHFLNAFLIILLIRSGWLIHSTQRPGAYWTRRNRGLLKTPGQPKKHSINHWLHFSLDWLWVINGAVFLVLLFVSGQWMRIVPTSWEVFPNALSVLVQYASLDWPTENGWVDYNSLQVLAYFTTVFIAAPLAIATGIRLSPLWRTSWTAASRVYPIEWARKLHLPIMVYFVLFIIAHVTLVMATGALRNLNHMYAVRDDDSWVGFGFFAGSLVLIVAGWFAVRPALLRPVAQLTGDVTRG